MTSLKKKKVQHKKSYTQSHNSLFFFKGNRRVQASTVLLLKLYSVYNKVHETKKGYKEDHNNYT